MTTKKGYTRFPGGRLKEVIGPHVAKKLGEDFDPALDFTPASVQFLEAVTQSSNIQFSKGTLNGDDEVGNVIGVKIVASGTHTLTFSSDFTSARNDFLGAAGTFDIIFMLLLDGKIMYSVIQRS